MFGGLVLRVVVLGSIAMLALGYKTMVDISQDHRDRVAAGCREHSVPGVAVVRVRAGDVAYARRQGWPRVLVAGGWRTGDVVGYDSGPSARRVEAATAQFCRGQRYRLKAR